MDIDAASGELCRESVGQDLHVAGEDDEIYLSFLDDLQDCRFLPLPGLRRDREMVEPNGAEIVVPVSLDRMVGHDTGNIDGEFTDPPAVEQIRQTMVEPRH